MGLQHYNSLEVFYISKLAIFIALGSEYYLPYVTCSIWCNQLLRETAKNENPDVSKLPRLCLLTRPHSLPMMEIKRLLKIVYVWGAGLATPFLLFGTSILFVDFKAGWNNPEYPSFLLCFPLLPVSLSLSIFVNPRYAQSLPFPFLMRVNTDGIWCLHPK